MSCAAEPTSDAALERHADTAQTLPVHVATLSPHAQHGENGDAGEAEWDDDGFGREHAGYFWLQ